MSIRIGILGYGNLGRGVESAIAHNEDMELVGVFTRRNPENVKVRTAGVKVLAASELDHMVEVRRICRLRHPNMRRITTLWTALIPTQESRSISQTLTLLRKRAAKSALFPAAGILACSP